MNSKQQAYADKVSAQIDQTQAEISRLTAKAKESSADVRISIQKEVDDLKAKTQTAKASLGKVKEATSDAWEDAKGGAEGAWKELSSAVESAKRRYG